MLQLDICKPEVMLLPLPVPVIGITNYSKWNPSSSASLLQARCLVQMCLHWMPDPCPMFGSEELQDLKGWLKHKTELNGGKWEATNTVASGCALRPSRSSGSCFWGCGGLPEMLWGMSGWQLALHRESWRNHGLLASPGSLSWALPSAPDKGMH